MTRHSEQRNTHRDEAFCRREIRKVDYSVYMWCSLKCGLQTFNLQCLTTMQCSAGTKCTVCLSRLYTVRGVTVSTLADTHLHGVGYDNNNNNNMLIIIIITTC